jgi:hypothetical protein
MTTLYSLILSIAALSAHPAMAQEFLLHGKMVFTNIEGGCWYLDAGGKHYELTGDSAMVASTHIEGAYVTVSVEPAKGAMSACMVGEIVKLVQVQESERHPVDAMVSDMDVKGIMHKSADGKWYVQSSKKVKFLLVHPIAKYKHTGARYHRFSRVVQEPVRGEYTGSIIGDARKVTPAP